jgi:hypothetical protein
MRTLGRRNAEILDSVRMTEPQYPLEAAEERDNAVTA